MRIVVVEDEVATRRGIIKLIKKVNPEFVVVGEADNGYDGMLLIKELHPDVVIADIVMPRIDGLRMIENARSCSPDTKYIILSGYEEFEFARRAVHLHVTEYLLKPITVDQLTQVLNKIYEMVRSKKVDEENSFQEKNYSPVVQYIVEDVMMNYAKDLSLKDYADQFKISPGYLGSIFAKETGKSFSVFLRDVRMERAKWLLENTNDKIYEIAYKTGYTDVKYFCKVFKECMNVSPKQYASNKILKKNSLNN